MYLVALKQNIKEKFLDLAIALAKADNDYEKREEEVIRSYCMEMNIEYREQREESDVKKIILELDNMCDNQEKRVVVFESVGLAMADSYLDEREREILTLAAYVFGLDEDYVMRCIEKIEEYKTLQRSINEFVLMV